MRSTFMHRIRYRPLPLLGMFMLAPVAVAQNSDARKEIVQPIPPGASSAALQGSPDWQETRAKVIQTADVSIIAVVDEWKRLQQSDGYGFTPYANFIMANPSWPAEARMRSVAERSINPQSFSPPVIVSFFGRFTPQSATGYARYALALSAMGRTNDARDAARKAWRMGAMGNDDETWLLTTFGSALSADDHAAHADAALWSGNATAAERSLMFLPASIRPVIEARIAMQRNSPDAAMKIQSAEAFGKGNAGFIADRANWLRGNGNSLLARNLLAGREKLTTRPVDPEKWYEALLVNARAAANDSQWTLAYNIASKVDDAYAPGVDIRDQSLGERDDYTSLVWLAGTTAFYQLNRPRDAMTMFDNYGDAARSPQTMSKGWYWAGRAALKAGDKAKADEHFNMAAAYPDQYYGQLALERLGLPMLAPTRFAQQVEVSADQQKAFDQRPLVRAAKALGAAGRWQDQSIFLRTLAAGVTSDTDRALTDALSERIGRPDLAVMVGRRARPDGSAVYNLASFPSISVPDGHQDNWTMIHAITRQESQFDKAAVSHAGARGLMQLMPGTARETAGRVGLSYNLGGLTTDTSYNIMLGSTYFQRMLSYFGGSYPLAIAAYNAGPGNVNKWLAANGDPRIAGGDIVRWIEEIPIYETRNYVQRVLENAVVYDAVRAKENGRAMTARPLSRYLGKNDVG